MAIRGIRIQGAIGWVAGAAIMAMALPVAASDEPSGPIQAAARPGDRPSGAASTSWRSASRSWIRKRACSPD